MKQDLDHKIRDTYQLDKLTQRIWKQLKNELSKENITIIERYDTAMVKQSLGKATRIKHLKILLSLTRRINKEWNSVTKDDIDRLVREIMQEYGDVNGDETETSRDFKKILKLFFRWFKLGTRDYKEVGDPPETKGIRLKKPKDKITRESLLKEEDLTRLLHACGENLRDRSFIDMHFEAGTRPGEILSLQIKHVEFDKYGAKIHVDGKTGARPIRLIKSTPNLAAWINAHPFRENQDAPLWILLDKKSYGKPMTYAAAREMVSRRCQMANLLKHVNLKLFRHSEATNTAKFMTEAEMKKRHGWTKGSNMPSRYVHLVDSDVEEKILNHYGILKKEDEINAQLPKICFICQIPNSSDSKICTKCGKPLDLKTANELDEEKEQRIVDLEKQQRFILEELEKVQKRQQIAEKYEKKN